MLFITAKQKGMLLAVLLVLAAPRVTLAASVSNLAGEFQVAEECLISVSREANNPASAAANLRGFLRSLAKDIYLAQSWRTTDEERALVHLGTGTCGERIARWVDANAPVTYRPATSAKNGMDAMPTAQTANQDMSDLEFYLKSRQAAIEAIARIQANPRAYSANFRR